MENTIHTIVGYIWSTPMIVLAILVGLYFSLASGFLQLRKFREMLSLVFEDDKSGTGISSFQALAISIAARVGTGNIAGVATAIAVGGPGAIFWMWVIAFVGSATAFAESVLAQIYKERTGNEFRGGTAFFIEQGLHSPFFGMVFAVVVVFAMGFAAPGVHSSELASAIEVAFGVNPLITGVVVAFFVGIVIFGGIKRIGRVAEYVVPFMAIVYILAAAIIIGMNIGKLPAVIALIVKSAVGADAAFGAILGSAISWGVKRGIYSNEAGMGSAPPFAAAASVSHPVKQGFVQAFSVYIDTMLVCSATAFMILITGAYNVADGAGGFIVQGLDATVDAGSTFTQAAVNAAFPGYGEAFVAIILIFFVYTTILGNYYTAEAHAGYIEGKLKSKQRWLITAVRLAILYTVVSSAVRAASLSWAIGDIALGLMTWMNLIAVILLRKPVMKALKDYEQQRARGVNPSFDPVRLGIRNADFWEHEFRKDAGHPSAPSGTLSVNPKPKGSP